MSQFEPGSATDLDTDGSACRGSSGDETQPGTGGGPVPDRELRKLLEQPGTERVCVVDLDSGRLLAEVAPQDTRATSRHAETAAVLDYGLRLASLSRLRAGLDDVIITSRDSFHLLRQVTGHDSSVWVYLHVDRDRGNLALARRALSTISVHQPRAVPPPVGAAEVLPFSSPPQSRRRASAVPLPRHSSKAPSASRRDQLRAVPPPAECTEMLPAWSTDTHSMRRLLVGLRRLA